MGKSRVILPKKLISNPAAMGRAITNALEATARAIQVDFKVTTQTWEHGVSFAIEAPTPWQRLVGTTDGIYTMLNEGTRAHTIAPRAKKSLAWSGPFRSKTLPHTIASSAGSRGGAETILPRGRVVHHPGTAAREWDTTIAQKWNAQFPAIMQRAIDASI